MRKMQGGGGIPQLEAAMAAKQQIGAIGGAGANMIADHFELGNVDPVTGMVNQGEVAARAGLVDWASSGFNPISGLIGLYKGNKQAKEINEAATMRNRFNSAYQQFGKDAVYSTQDAYTPMMPYGGLVPYQDINTETVELESGEPYRLPDGTIDAIPTSAPTHKQGGVPITLPAGTQVLGKKKSMNGKQFKELGRKLERAQNKYEKTLDNNPTSLATKTAKRMLNNIQAEYTKLFNEQGVDVGGQQMPNGGKVYKGDPMIQSHGYTPEQFRMAKEGDTLSKRPFYDPATDQFLGYKVLRKGQPGETYQWLDDRSDDNTGTFMFNNKKLISGSEIPEFRGGGKVGKKLIRKGQEGLSAASSSDDILRFQKFAGIDADGIWGPKTSEAWSVLGNEWNRSNLGLPAVTPITVDTVSNPTLQTDTNIIPTAGHLTPIQNRGTSFDYTSLLNTVGALAPVAYNIGQGLSRPTTFNERDFINPYATSSQRLMRNRRYNIQPELEANASNAAAYNRRLRELGLSRGQIVGGLQAGNVAKTRSDAEVLARAQNINNQYLAEQAQFDYGVGSDMINRRFQLRDYNLRNEAARKNYMAAGLSQLSQYSQTQQLQKNQALRDQQRLNLLPSLVSNFKFDPTTGMWEHTTTGQKMTEDQALNWSYIYGKSNN